MIVAGGLRNINVIIKLVICFIYDYSGFNRVYLSDESWGKIYGWADGRKISGLSKTNKEINSIDILKITCARCGCEMAWRILWWISLDWSGYAKGFRKNPALKIWQNSRNYYCLYCMKQRLYIDTSVFGGYFDEEFSEFTRPLFESSQGSILKW